VASALSVVNRFKKKNKKKIDTNYVNKYDHKVKSILIPLVVEYSRDQRNCEKKRQK